MPWMRYPYWRRRRSRRRRRWKLQAKAGPSRSQPHVPRRIQKRKYVDSSDDEEQEQEQEVEVEKDEEWTEEEEERNQDVAAKCNLEERLHSYNQIKAYEENPTTLFGLANHMTHSRQVQQRYYHTSIKWKNTAKAFRSDEKHYQEEGISVIAHTNMPRQCIPLINPMASLTTSPPNSVGMWKAETTRGRSSCGRFTRGDMGILVTEIVRSSCYVDFMHKNLTVIIPSLLYRDPG
ncbi:hypothetical protein BSL78_02061 [Apostichopus japonicus]|uniref:Uncharacterized protein n=1 Tax=Stichopus japonicus TaxID=307972 RepID=A0A2G8LLG9_STIJA|nr:hypothetical protein BSL78_02061 [Apostichopus japonicus]